MEPHRQAAVRNLAGAALQHCLSAAADGQQAAFSRALGLEIVLLELLAHLPHQEVLESDAGAVLSIISRREFRQPVGNLHMEAGGRCERIPLYMINDQRISVEFPRPRKGFVGRVALAVHGAQ